MASPYSKIRLACWAVAVVCAGTLAPGPAAARPVACVAAAVAVATPAATPVADWAENIGYDAAGNLWVSRLLRGQVQRHDRAGKVTATVPVADPGAVRLGPDHLMYVVSGDAPTGLLPGAHAGAIVRFDPVAAAPRPQPFVTGLAMPNGAVFDAAGNLYVADTATGVVKVRRDGAVDTAWTAQAHLPAVNGIAVDGDSLYVTLYYSSTGRIMRVPLAAPARAVVAVDLALGAPIPPLPDDLAVGPDHALYDATTTGALVRVDPGAHTACVLYTGQPLTAVAVDPRAPGELVIGTESGDLLRARLPLR
jgi:sugar lactone lactonase YvrE